MTESSVERRWSRRLLWAAAAQAASSATNFVLYVGLLWTAETEVFGRWVAVLAVYHLTIALSRSLVSEPIVAAAGGPADAGTGPAFTWAWGRRRYRAIGAMAAVGVALVGWSVGADARVVVAVALALPLLVRQDGLRSLAWARSRPARSIALDGVWIGATAVGLVGVVALDVVSPEALVLIWLAGGVVSTVAGGLLVDRRDAGPASNGRPAPNRPAVPPPSGESPPGLEARLHARRRSQAILTTARNLLPIAVAAVAGPAAAGLLKAALLPYTPVLSLVAGLRMVVLPALQRAAEAPAGSGALDRLVVRLLGRYLLGAGLAALATQALVAGLGSRYGPEALPDGPLLAWGAAIAVMTIASTVLADGIGFGRRSLPVVRLRLVELTLEWATVLLVARMVGPDLAVVGWAAGMALGALVWTVAGLRPDSARSGPTPVHPLRPRSVP